MSTSAPVRPELIFKLRIIQTTMRRIRGVPLLRAAALHFFPGAGAELSYVKLLWLVTKKTHEAAGFSFSAISVYRIFC